MRPAIAQRGANIATICQRFNVSRPEVFGSAARADDFNVATSDVDFLIEFSEGAASGLQDFVACRHPSIHGYAKSGHMPKSAQNNKLLHCNKS